MTNLAVGAHFNGPDYDPGLDKRRLTGQILRVYLLMSDQRWRTLGEVAAVTSDPEASISAQLRHLRKEKFGEHAVQKRRRPGLPESVGLWEYRLIVNTGEPEQVELF